MKIKYDYSTTIKSVDTKGKFRKRPIIEIEVIGEKGSKRMLGLIDSGADMVMLNMEYAEVLGFDLDKMEKGEMLGIGDQVVPTFIGEMKFKVKHFNETFTSPVAFTSGGGVDVLLGQESFFEIFRIKFEKDHDRFELTLSKKGRGK